MKDNILRATLHPSETRWVGNLYQYDYGQRIIFSGVDLPESYEVHFANSETGVSVTVLGDETGVDIPDALLLTGEEIFIWVFLHSGLNDGETVYKARITVTRRAEITHEEPTPVQQDEITQLIAALNRAVEESETNVTHYPIIQNGIWMIWDAETGDYVSSGINATGPKGDTGERGETGEAGPPGPRGDPGEESVMVGTLISGNMYRLGLERV